MAYSNLGLSYINGQQYYDYPSTSTDTTGQTTSGTTAGTTTGATTGTTSGTTTSTWSPNLPYYSSLSDQASQTALSNLQGILPGDVVSQMEQTAAERGISTGSDSSPNANAALLRALGLTSRDLTTLGEQQYNTLLSSAPRTTVGTSNQTTSGTSTGATTGTTTGQSSGTQTSDLGFEQASALNSILAAQYGTTAGTAAGATPHAATAPSVVGGAGSGAGTQQAAPSAPVYFPQTTAGNFGGTVASNAPATAGWSGGQTAAGIGGAGLSYWTDPTTGMVHDSDGNTYTAEEYASLTGGGTPATQMATAPTTTDQQDSDLIDYYGNLGYDTGGGSGGDTYSDWYD